MKPQSDGLTSNPCFANSALARSAEERTGGFGGAFFGTTALVSLTSSVLMTTGALVASSFLPAISVTEEIEALFFPFLLMLKTLLRRPLARRRALSELEPEVTEGTPSLVVDDMLMLLMLLLFG